MRCWQTSEALGGVTPSPSTCYNTLSSKEPLMPYNPMDDLTPEERAALAQATPQDFADAIRQIATDRSFWIDMAQAFLDGMARGFDKRR